MWKSFGLSFIAFRGLMHLKCDCSAEKVSTKLASGKACVHETKQTLQIQQAQAHLREISQI